MGVSVKERWAFQQLAKDPPAVAGEMNGGLGGGLRAFVALAEDQG